MDAFDIQPSELFEAIQPDTSLNFPLSKILWRFVSKFISSSLFTFPNEFAKVQLVKTYRFYSNLRIFKELKTGSSIRISEEKCGWSSYEKKVISLSLGHVLWPVKIVILT